MYDFMVAELRNDLGLTIWSVSTPKRRWGQPRGYEPFLFRQTALDVSFPTSKVEGDWVLG
jgi:hypothetical protein